KAGWGVAPQQTKPHAAVFLTGAPLPAGAERLTFRLEQSSKEPGHNLGRFRLSATNDARVLQRAKVPPDILAMVDDAEIRCSDDEEKLAKYYRSIAPLLKPVRDEIARLEKARPAVPALPVMVELPADKRRATKIMIKGNFLNTGDTVDPGVP